MRKLLTVTLIIFITVTVSGQEPSLRNNAGYYKNYHKEEAIKLQDGYFYPGKYHPHWTTKVFSKRYDTYVYWCPCTTEWYYWCPPHKGFYSVTVCPFKKYKWSEQGPELSPIRPLH
jgi:hypothetical protein